MRVVVFLVYLFLNLLGVGNDLHSSTHQSHIYNFFTSNLAKNEQVIFSHTNHNSIIIGDADLDLEEEFLSHDDLKNAGSNKFSFQQNSLLAKNYFAHSRLHILNFYARGFKISLPFCGLSNPIYISQRALRI